MPKFSVLIPTYNRKPYLFHTVKTCVEQKFLDAEFLVVDDCSTDGTEEMIKSEFNDSRVKYFKHSQNLGMLLNFEEGLSLCNGDYVIVLGSDDGLMPRALEDLNQLINETGADLITWPTPAFFYEGTKMPTSQLVYPKALTSDSKPEWLTSDDFFTRNAEELAYVGDKMCPMLYVKSIAKRQLISEVVTKSGGKFYSCSTPDGYSAFALLCQTEKYLYTAKPYSLHGVSPSSAGVNYVKATDPKNDLSEKFFKDSKNRKLHSRLANAEYSPLISVMTADFILTAKDVLSPERNTVNIDIRNLLTKACRELCDGLMDEKKVPRELKILQQIASNHDLSRFFEELISSMFRNRRKTLEGDAISPSARYINMTKRNVFDVYHASLYVDEVLSGKQSLSFKTPYFIFNSIRYLMLGKLKTNTSLYSLIEK